MPKFEYKGHQFETDHELSDEEWTQTLSYFDSIGPKEAKKEDGVITKGAKDFARSAAGLGIGALDFIGDTPQYLASLPTAIGAGVGTGDYKGALEWLKQGGYHAGNVSSALKSLGIDTMDDTYGKQLIPKVMELIGKGIDKTADFIGGEGTQTSAATNLALQGLLAGGVPGAKQAGKFVTKHIPDKVVGARSGEQIRKDSGYSNIPDSIVEEAFHTTRNDLSGFSWNPETKRMERGNLYVDPHTNSIVDPISPTGTLRQTGPSYVRPETKVEGIRQLEHQAGEPLVIFPDGTTMTRAEYNQQRAITEDRTGVGPIPPTMTPRDVATQDMLGSLEKTALNFPERSRAPLAPVEVPLSPEMVGNDVNLTGSRNPYFTKGIDPSKVNVEVDSVGSNPIFNEKVEVESPRNNAAGKPLAGTHNKTTNETLTYLNGVLDRWSRGLPDHVKSFIKSAEDLRTFVAAHEEAHATWKQGKNESDAAYEKRVNKEAKKLYDQKKSEVEQPPVPEETPGYIRDKYEGPLPSGNNTLSPKQLRARRDQLVSKLESVERRLAEVQEAADMGRDTGQVNTGKLDNFRKALEDQIGQIEYAIEQGQKRGINFGKNQRGSVNFGFSEAVVDAATALKKKISKEDFTAEMMRIVPNLTTEQAYKLWEKHYGDIKTNTPAQTALSRIPGVKETISPELQPLESMIDRWKNESDISSNSTAKALRENLSPGRMTALRTGNTLVDWFIEDILGETRKAQVKTKEITHGIKGDVKELTGSILSNFRTKGEGTKLFVDTMLELMRVQGKTDIPNITDPVAKRFATNLRNQLNQVHEMVNAELRAQGSGLVWETNYLAHSFFGPYRVLAKDLNGKIVGVIAGKTKTEMVSAMEHMKQQMPELEFGMPEYNRNFDNSGSELGKRYAAANEILNSFKTDSAVAPQFQKILGDYFYQTQKDYMGYRKHFEERKGAFGYEGNRSWDNAKNNAYDMLEAQLAVIDHAHMWLAEQKLARDLEQVMSNPDIKMPEAKEYVAMYLDHAFGRTKDQMAIVDSGIHFAARTMGISPASVKEALAIARNFALVNTLGMSGGFMLSQFVQVPQALSVAFAKAKGEGLTGGNSWLSLQVGNMDLIHGLAKNYDKMSDQGKFFFNYFKEHGTFDPHLIEHQLHRKVIPTTGMNLAQKSAATTTNIILKAMEKEAGLIGSLSIEKPEVRTRGMFAMTVAHYYHQAGMSLKEAAIRADKDTSNLFTDYSPQERAMGFQKLGELGKFAGTVSTFKINNLNQYVTFGNKKMYGALLALIATTWATSGLFGLPGSAEVEYVATQLKEQGAIEETPREWLIRESPDVVNFGPLSETPKIFGGKGIALHRKFAQDNILPDDIGSAIYALGSFWTNNIKNTYDAVKQPTTEKTAKAIRGWTPGNLKYGVDYFMLTNPETGITKDVNTLGDADMSGFKRDKFDWKTAAVMGVPTNDEFRVRTLSNLDKISQKAWKDRQTTMIDRTLGEWRDGNSVKFQKLFNDAVKFAPDTAPQAIITKLEAQATSMKLTKKQAMDLRMVKEAISQHNIERLQKYQQAVNNK